MKRLLWLLLLLPAIGYATPLTPVYCVALNLTQCNTTSNPGNAFEGDPWWKAMGKANAWGLQLGLFSNQPANEVLATPNGSSGIASPRALVTADIPQLNLSLTTGNGSFTGVLGVANGGTGASSLSGASIPTFTGAITTGDCAKWASATSLTDAGACGGGSGTVTDGAGTTTANELLLSSTTAHTYTNSATLPCTALPTLTGDVTNSGCATTVSKVSGSAGTPTTITTYNAASGSITVSPPTGALGTLNLTWPSVSGIIPAITGTVTTGDCAKFASATSITDAGAACGSGGSPAGSTYAVQTNGGSGAFGSVASPTSGAGYYVLRYDPTSTTAVAPTADQVGAGTRSLSGATTTDTVLYSDVLGVIVHDKAATGAVTETLPTPTSLGNSNFAFNYCNDSAQTDTIQPTTYQIAVNGGTAGASISIGQGVCASVLVDPFNASQWDAFTYGAGGSAGSGSTFLNLTSNVTTPSGGAATTVLTFSASANTSYYVTCHFSVSVNAGTAALVLTGPASPTSLVYFVEYNSGTLATAYGTNVILGTTTAQKPANGPTVINLQNGATAGTVTLQITNPGGGTDTATAYAGSFCRVN